MNRGKVKLEDADIGFDLKIKEAKEVIKQQEKFIKEERKETMDLEQGVRLKYGKAIERLDSIVY